MPPRSNNIYNGLSGKLQALRSSRGTSARPERSQDAPRPATVISEDALARTRMLAGAAYRWVGRMGRAALGPTAEPVPAAAVEEDPPPPRPSAPDPDLAPWLPLGDEGPAMCNVCRWHGDSFELPGHVEMSVCPSCGANGRDRFLHWCLATQVALHPALRIIECSPRLGDDYRAAMSSWFFYRTSDLDMRAHRGSLQLDLQKIALPDACIDVMLCSHVLEHVPDTDAALSELRRVIAPGGHLLLQVPVGQATTAPPPEPEFHMDWTPVFWRFGFDLTARLRQAGFDVDLLCTASFAAALDTDENPWPEWSREFDVPGMLGGAIRGDLRVIADAEMEQRLGIEPGYMYLTWDCRVPAPEGTRP